MSLPFFPGTAKSWSRRDSRVLLPLAILVVGSMLVIWRSVPLDPLLKTRSKAVTAMPPSGQRWIVTSLTLKQLLLKETVLSQLCNLFPQWRTVIVIRSNYTTTTEDEDFWRNVQVPDTMEKNCDILTEERQRQLGFASAQFVAGTNVKNLGYLYAISQNAEMILDLDVLQDALTPEALDSQTLQTMDQFHCVDKISSPISHHVNPCAHFNQPLLYPLGMKTSKYAKEDKVIYAIPTSKQLVPIQQKMVSRGLSEKSLYQGHQLDERLATVMPPVSPQEGNFIPLGESNTLFHRSAFWALLLPSSEEGPLVRGFWAQRLLWLMGGTAAFFPSSDFFLDPENSRLPYCNWAPGSYANSSYEQLYSEPSTLSYHRTYLMERLSDFLLQWHINNHSSSFFTHAISKLTRALSTSDQLEELDEAWGKDNALLDAWLYDLQEIGYVVKEEIDQVHQRKHSDETCNPEPVAPLWGEKTKKKAVLLVVAEKDYPYMGKLKPLEPLVDVFVSSWREKSSFRNSVLCKGCTWNQGRNKLLALAMQMYRGYEYFIFTDEDVALRENSAINSTIPFSGNAWRNFMNYLDKYKPPVLYPSFYYGGKAWRNCVSPDREIDTIYWFDALFNAFHIETIPTLLPYIEDYDSQSIWFSQVLMVHLANVLYPNQVTQVNTLAATNPVHRPYKKSKSFNIPEDALISALLKQEDKDKIITSDNNSWVRTVPFGLKGYTKKKYIFSRAELEERINSTSFVWSSIKKVEHQMKSRSRGVRRFYKMLERVLL